MQVRIARLPTKPDQPLPSRQTAHAAGYDVSSAEPDLVLAPGERRAVGTGLAFELPEGFEMQIRPRSGLALIWKIVLVTELLGRSSGVGFQIALHFQLFDVTGILAYTIAFVAIIQLIEWTILLPLERHVSRWRR